MRVLYYFFYSLGLFLAALFSPFHAKIRVFLSRHFGLCRRIHENLPVAGKSVFWFHVASSGELEQCIPIMDALKKMSPEITIHLSFFSPTTLNAVALEIKRREENGLLVPWDYADFSPLDFPFSVRNYIKALRATHFIAIHREIWPGIIDGCKHVGIPCFLFASYVSKTSTKTIRFYQNWLKLFSFIGTTESSSADLLKNLLPGIEIKTLGDPRVERVFARQKLGPKSSAMTRLSGRNIFVGASIWKGDFLFLLPGIKRLLELYPAWRIILAPHEPSLRFIGYLLNELKPLGCDFQLWSEWLSNPCDHTHIIVDRVGFLAELYRFSTLVYMGGSASHKIHNVLEPAAHGKPILSGPRIYNSAEAVEMWETASGLVKTANPGELTSELLRLVEETQMREELTKKLLRFMEHKRGADQRYADQLSSFAKGL